MVNDLPAGADQPSVLSHDADGNRASVAYPSGITPVCDYTGRGQLHSISIGYPQSLVTYTYDLAGNRIGKELANGTSASYVYDNANRLLTLSHQLSTSVFAQFDYTLNTVGNRTSKTQTGGAGFGTTAESYTYDAIDQITGVDYSTNSVLTRSVSYQYDPVGNRQSVSDSDQIIGVNYSTNSIVTRSVAYQYDPVGNRTNVTDVTGLGSITTAYLANPLNQYTQIAVSNQPSALSYDANGNLSGVAAGVSPAGPWTYQYDAQNRLLSATSATLAVQFQYDARNRCVNRKFYSWSSGSWLLTSDSYLTYDGWNLIEERDASGTLLDKYVHGAMVDEILIRYNGGAIYYHHDGLGSVTHLTDATGSVVESYTYDVYGAVSVWDAAGVGLPSSAFGNRFAFTGREYLAVLGLYDYRNRFYSPALGRFLQTDPKGLAADVNLNRYCANNPGNFVDPYGLTFWGRAGNIVVGAIGGAIGGLGTGAAVGAISGPGAAATAGLGALTGAFSGAIAGFVSGGENFSPVTAGLSGLKSGAISGLTGGIGTVYGATAGALTGGALGALDTGVSSGWDPKSMALAAAANGFFGWATGGAWQEGWEATLEKALLKFDVDLYSELVSKLLQKDPCK